jgi:energy-coupling factor transport system ATP-binding protein
MAIHISNVNFSFKNTKKIFCKLSVKIKDGDFIGIVGRNGIGKTTFSYLLNGLIPNEIAGNFSGLVQIDGISTRTKPVSYFAKSVGMVFQNPDFGIFNLTIREEIEFELKNLKIEFTENDLKNALSKVNLSKSLDTDPNTLSFGEKQKLTLASCIACNNKYLCLDEPSSMLDFESSINLYHLLHDLNNKGITIIVIDHNTEFLFRYANKILILGENGKYIFKKTADIVKNNNYMKSFGIKPPK